MPLSETVSGESFASLTIEMPPETLPALLGANSIRNDSFCPAAIETDDMLPAMLNPAPVMVAWEIVMEVEPVLLRVRVCGLLEPMATLPKFKVAELAASVAADAELVFDPLVPALVAPMHPVRDKSAAKERIRANNPSGARPFGMDRKRWKSEFVCALMTKGD